MVAKAGRWEEEGVTVYCFTKWEVLEMDGSDAAQQCEYIWNHWTEYLKMVKIDFMCIFHHNRNKLEKKYWSGIGQETMWPIIEKKYEIQT